jgi:hypothetical protein
MRPFRVLIRLKNPCLLFLTKWLGLKVFLGPQRTWIAPNAGCVEIFGRRSSTSPIADGVVSGVSKAADGLNAADWGNMVGRDGPRSEVNVLGVS